MNIFEGSRRICLVIQGIGFLAFLASLYSLYDDNLKIKFVTVGPTDSFRLVTDSFKCPAESGNDYIWSYSLQSGKEIYADVCFASSEFSNGKQLVPYRLDNEGNVWGKPYYDSEIKDYIDTRMRGFKLTGVQEAIIEEQYLGSKLAALWKEAKGYAQVWIMFVFGFLVFQCVVGWVVRGFMHIPTGMDKRVGKD